MALTNGIAMSCSMSLASDDFTITAFTAADGIDFAFDGADERMILLLSETGGSANSTMTIKGIEGVSNDIPIVVTKGKCKCIALESALYRQPSGEHAGKVFITASGGTPAAALMGVQLGA